MKQTITFIIWSIGGAFGSYLSSGSAKEAFLISVSLFCGAVMSYFMYGKD